MIAAQLAWKSTMIALALLLGFAVSGATLISSGPAYAQTWNAPNNGGGAG
jgi:hypothetical protein